jgi:signal peptidase I
MWEWTKTLTLSVAVFLALRVAVVEAYVVPTGSMRPTIVEGDRVLGSKFHYRFFAPERGDVVVFRPPEAVTRAGDRADRYLKRVVAVGGDTVEVRDGTVRVNGEIVDEPWIAAPPAYRMDPVRVPEGQLFVLGDNRNESFDSHAWGFLDQDRLLARVFACYWPLDHLRRF